MFGVVILVLFALSLCAAGVSVGAIGDLSYLSLVKVHQLLHWSKLLFGQI